MADREKIMKLLQDRNKDVNQQKSSSVAISPFSNLLMPADITTWRATHVQAWVAYRLDLPECVENFREASIDGLVLLKYVDDVALRDMKVTNILHRRKILEGISMLQVRQEELEEKKREALALKELEKRKNDQLKEKKKGKKKKKKTKRKKVKPVSAPIMSWTGEVREHNGVERVKLIRDMRLMRARQQEKKALLDSRSSTWRFEYSGAPKPSSGDLYEALSSDKTASNLFSNAMKSLSRSEKLDLINQPREARTIPSTCPFEEVLMLVKGAMYEVSERLMQIEYVKRNAEKKRDSDLDDILITMPSFTAPGGDEDLPQNHEGAEEDLKHDSDPEDIDGDEGDEADEEDADEEGEEEEEGPPPYDDVSEPPPPYEAAVLTNLYSAEPEVPPDRITLVFQAFIDQQNNGAKWLGSNGKLTRLKFSGGIETILGLTMRWEQFDTLWTRLDSARSGELDLNEFKAFFGDLSEFNETDGAQTMSTTTGNQAMVALTKSLYALCDNMRHAGFLVVDMYASFDRDGSGEISVSEFCSMLRTVLGKAVDKKLIYRAFHMLDTDGTNAVSKEELLIFIYKIWRSQLDELAGKLARLDEVRDAQLIRALVKERNDIKEALKKNYPREWRDMFERLGSHTLPGPFAALLSRMGLGGSYKPGTLTGSSISERRASSTPGPPSPSKQKMSVSAYNYGTEKEDGVLMPEHSTSLSSITTKNSGKKARKGNHEIMRMRLIPADAHAPHREGAILKQPTVKDLNANRFKSGEITDVLLRKTEPLSQKLFANTVT